MCLFGRINKITGLLGIILAVTILSACSAPVAVPTTTPTVTPTVTPPPVTTTLGLSASPISKATPVPQTGLLFELRQYVLELINKDRKEAGLGAVTLADNAASQKHADDMLTNYYLSHWDTAGLKPYMRYTLEGGFNYESENSAYSGWFNKADDLNRYAKIDAKEELKTLQYKMMKEDAESNWGHRDTILNKWHKKVSIGIAYNQNRLALVQQFEGDYIEFIQLPTLLGGTLSLGGKINLGTLDAVALYYDPLPQPKTPQELISGQRSYSLGPRLGHLIAPPPPGMFYSSTSPGAIQASKWEVDQSGSFSIQADINPALINGKGVYTIAVWIKSNNESKNLTNYSIFVK